MSIQQLCDYLNEIGILDMNNIKQFLQITTYMINNKIKNKSNKSVNDIYKISLFSYIRKLNDNDQNLYFTCSNIINSYKRYIILKKYNSLFLFKKLIYLKIYQIYKSFLISLYKKYPFKSYHTNKYHQNKKKKIKNKTCTNNFYNAINNDNNDIINNELSNSNKKINKVYNNINNNENINLNYNPNINNNIITFKQQEDNKENILFQNYKFMQQLNPIKKNKKLDINYCINQINMNFEKYFINKKLILCKKNHTYSSYIDRVKTNKKELLSKNPYEYSYSSFTLRKNKSETKLRIRKMIYEEKTRSNNFATIKPEMKKKIKLREKSKKDEELLAKEKKDKALNNLTKNEIDKSNWVDRLYRMDAIKKKEEERKQKEENKHKQSPINWEQLYLETNDKIIKNNNEPKMSKSCSYFMPKRGRIYNYKSIIKSVNKEENNINNNEKENKTIETNNNNVDTNINIDNNKSVKISIELNNSPNKSQTENNPNIISNNAFEIKESELNSINSEKEENRINEENKEIKSSNITNNNDDNDSNSEKENIKRKENIDKYNISLEGMQSECIKDLLLKKNLSNKKNSEMNLSDSNNKQNEIKEEGKKEEKDKNDFNYLLCSNNDTDNII